jgi:hypothetical protein
LPDPQRVKRDTNSQRVSSIEHPPS